MIALFCFFFGHRLGIFRVNRRRVAVFMHISDLAGLDSVCFRCGMRCNDAGPIEVAAAPQHPYRARGALP